MTVTTIVNEESLKEMRRYLMAPKRKLTLACVFIVLAVIAALLTYFQRFIFAGIILIIFTVLLVETLVVSSKSVEMNLKQIARMYNANEIRGELHLQKKSLTYHNITAESEKTFSYEAFRPLKKSTNYFALITKDWSVYLIPRSQFTAEEELRFTEHFMR